MKRILTIVCALALLSAAKASAQDSIAYGFTLSADSTNSLVNSVPAFGGGGPVNVFLWMHCSLGDGISAAEFDLNFTPPPSLFGWALTMKNGWLNAGGASNLLLAVGGCPTGPVLVGQWAGFNTGGPIAHNFCLIPSAATSTFAGVDCSPAPTLHQVKQIGLDAGVGSNSCADPKPLCTIAVEATSWGQVKSLYR